MAAPHCDFDPRRSLFQRFFFAIVFSAFARCSLNDLALTTRRVAIVLGTGSFAISPQQKTKRRMRIAIQRRNRQFGSDSIPLEPSRLGSPDKIKE